VETLRIETVGNLEAKAAIVKKRLEGLQAAKVPPKKKGRKSTGSENRQAEITTVQAELSEIRYRYISGFT
jgi:hypothetical protein